MIAPAEWLLLAAARETTLFAAAGLLIGGIDDLAIDLIWLARSGWRRIAVYSRHERTTMATLPPPRKPGRLAIFVPAWREEQVIGAMLRNALSVFRHDDYLIYVGTYPNDPETVNAVRSIADPRIRVVGGERPGPTTKAECLNRLWHALRADERGAGGPFKAIVLHDAEDAVHPSELALYDRMIERFDLVQIPVLPLAMRGKGMWSHAVAATYCDEFAEAHGKQLVVREALGAGLPSAGVGCALGRNVMERIAEANGGDPFDEQSLTEDYELGLRLRGFGGRGAFVVIPGEPGGMPVAVRAHFPDTFETAVRQKARWTIGIALAGWDRLRWDGGVAECWMRLRDRRTVLAAVLLAVAYVATMLDALCWLGGLPQPWSPPLRAMLAATSLLLAWRLCLRGAIVARLYGVREGLLSMPRMILSNLIAIAAAWRALVHYVPGRRPRWDKTAHVFPEGLRCD